MGRRRPARPDRAVQGRVVAGLDEAAARAMTEELRQALEDARQTATVLAERVRAAHEARVWIPLHYGSWESYARAEFGVSRAQAYRLLDISRAAGAIHAALAAADVSPTGDTLDLHLSGRALRDAHAHLDAVTDLITTRLTDAAAAGYAVSAEQMRDIVHQAIADARRSPAPLAIPSKDPQVARGRQKVAQLETVAAELGRLMLWVAPAYLSEARAAVPLAVLAEQIGMSLEDALAHRRYATTGDRRALQGTLL